MGKKSKKIKGGGLVYSTDKETMSSLFDGIRIQNESPVSKNKSIDKKYTDQVRVWLDRKQRGGKEVTLIKGINRPNSQLKEIASILKAQCGVGGTAKNGEIIIQGNHRKKIMELLIEMGYSNTKLAGA